MLFFFGHTIETYPSLDVEAEDCVKCGKSHFHTYAQVKRSTVFFVPVDVQWIRAHVICSNCEDLTENHQLTEELRQHIIQNAPALPEQLKKRAKLQKKPVSALLPFGFAILILFILLRADNGNVWNFIVYLFT